MSARASQVAVARVPGGGWMAYDRSSQDALWIDPFDERNLEGDGPLRTPPDLLGHSWPAGIRLRAVAFSHLHRDSRLHRGLRECGDVPWIVRGCDRATWQRFHARGHSEIRPRRETAEIVARVAPRELPSELPGPWCDPTELGMPLLVGRHQVRFIALPGHTLGSVAVVVADACFAGDTLIRGGIGTHPRSDEARAALRHSLEQLIYGTILRDNVTLYCGDGSVTTRAQERRRNGPLALLRASTDLDATSDRKTRAAPARTDLRRETQSKGGRADAAFSGAPTPARARDHRVVEREFERD